MTNTITTSTGNYEIDQWKGHVITINGVQSKVKSNNATTLTIRPYRWYERAWDRVCGWTIRAARAVRASLSRTDPSIHGNPKT